MGMVIYNNLSAMRILNESNRNHKKATRASQELALGDKITSAADDASGYSITEKMKVNIRSLDQCNANSSKGKNMLDQASEAVDQQVNILKQVKIVALKATDGTYTDSDRKILQKEIWQLLDQCDDIANETTFNGIELLNKSTLSRVDKWFDSAAPYHPNKDNTPVMTQAMPIPYTVPTGKEVAVTPTNTYNTSVVVKGSDYPAVPADGDWVWDNASGALAQVYYDIGSGAMLLGGPGGTRITVNGQSNPPGNPPDSTTNISVPEHPLNTGLPAVGSSVAKQKVAAINSSGNVVTPTFTVTNAKGSGVLSYFDTTDTNTSVMELDFSALQGAVSSVGDLDGKGFSLNCGGCDQFITVMFDASTAESTLYEGNSGDPHPLAYVIGVANVDMANLSASIQETIFNGISEANTVSGGATLPSATDVSVSLERPVRHDIKMNYYPATGKFTISKTGPTITFMNGIRGEMVEEPYFLPEQKKALQTDTTSAQFTKVKLPNTTVDAMFPSFSSRWDTDVKADDYPEKWPEGYELLENDAQRRQKWAEEIWPYAVKMSGDLDRKHCVETMDKANVFLAQVDQALKYLLGANTTLGAESARLHFTMANLTTRSENETNSLSAMRDTDMAKSYAEYVKNNMLTQASQSMLAQSNQNASGVLSLLK